MAATKAECPKIFRSMMPKRICELLSTFPFSISSDFRNMKNSLQRKLLNGRRSNFECLRNAKIELCLDIPMVVDLQRPSALIGPTFLETFSRFHLQ